MNRTYYSDLDPQRALLGALLAEQRIPDSVRPKLYVGNFSPRNRLLASAILKAFEDYGKCDILAAHDALNELGGRLEDINQLGALSESAPVGADIEHLFRVMGNGAAMFARSLHHSHSF